MASTVELWRNKEWNLNLNPENCPNQVHKWSQMQNRYGFAGGIDYETFVVQQQKIYEVLAKISPFKLALRNRWKEACQSIRDNGKSEPSFKQWLVENEIQLNNGY